MLADQADHDRVAGARESIWGPFHNFGKVVQKRHLDLILIERWPGDSPSKASMQARIVWNSRPPTDRHWSRPNVFLCDHKTAARVLDSFCSFLETHVI